LNRVALAQEGGKIVVDENPSAPGLACGKCATLCAAAHLLGMHLEKGSGFGERQRLHRHDGIDKRVHQRRWLITSVGWLGQLQRDDFWL
jgi:hypothetical protein